MRRLPNSLLVTVSACATLAMSASAMAKVAGVTISSAPTENMQCASGVCSPTATTAVLNVGDLESMLAAGDVEVTTTGSVEAENLNVKAALSWSGATTLSLAAADNITISKAVVVQGDGGVSLASATGFNVDSLYFVGSGSVTFDNLADSLVINGASYALAGDIATLASDIAANPAGNYALANSYNAKHDGTYSGAPIPTPFTGIFEGLGNKITNLAINDTSGGEYVGLFGEVGSYSATIRDIGLKKVTVTASGQTGPIDAGALVGWLTEGFVMNSYAIGTVTVSGSGSFAVGGLVGYTYDYVENSYANCAVSATSTGTNSVSVNAGGLAGIGDAIGDSYAEGSVTAQGAGNLVTAGGLLGNQDSGGSFVVNSYATGAASASGGANSHTVSGGLIGYEPDGGGTIYSYATGTATASGGSSNIAGGLLGVNIDNGNNTDNYWDTTTSGTNTGVGQGDDSGVTGMTTQQLQSGLPTGFNPPTWGESAAVNNGLPYLLTNKPKS